jgi:hypothetical protein
VTVRTRRQLVVLGALIGVGALLVLLRPSPGDQSAGGVAPRAADAPQDARAGAQAGQIGLERLEGRSGDSQSPARNLFRFESRRSAAPPARPVPAIAQAPTGPPPELGPPPPPPIPLRFIGYLDQPGDVPRIAVLSDGRGNVFNGKEGDIIEGRYRVLRIGTDSADLVYVDGRGRQTIRLSGQ